MGPDKKLCEPCAAAYSDTTYVAFAAMLGSLFAMLLAVALAKKYVVRCYSCVQVGWLAAPALASRELLFFSSVVYTRFRAELVRTVPTFRTELARTVLTFYIQSYRWN